VAPGYSWLFLAIPGSTNFFHGVAMGKWMKMLLQASKQVEICESTYSKKSITIYSI
jgi:hypothetical protein